MPGSSNFFDNQPLRYFRGQAIYLTMYFTLALLAGVILVLLLQSAGFDSIYLMYFPGATLHGALWQPFTYVFVNPMSFFTPLILMCFYSWGAEVEKYMGRRRFTAICGALIFTPVLYGFLLYAAHIAISADSMFYLTSGLLISFATLYPNMDYIGGWVPLKWFAFICIACGSLTYFPHHEWAQLSVLWLNCFVGWASIQYARGELPIPRIRLPSFKRKPKFRVLEKAEVARERTVLDEPETDADALLDKIARSGLQSLTEAERARLEKARQELLKKGQ